MPGPLSTSGSTTSMAERAGHRVPTTTGRSTDASASKCKASSKGELDPQLWHACAGAMVHMPHVGESVIYFPQGHAEHAASLPEFPPSLAITCTVLCRVLSVKFLADTETDEVYARIRLQPDPLGDLDPHEGSPASPNLPEKSASFAKTLTQSDANNGGGFSVPRYCAETIFPRLDYSQDPPVQIVLAKDVHGTVWKFRHIYRGTPRRHLLTTGWSNFVNQKKLVAGDAIVFLRNAAGELCVGVRRSTRGTTTGANTSLWHLTTVAASNAAPSSWKFKPPDNSFDFLGASSTELPSTRALRSSSDTLGTANFARNRARVTAKDVIEASSLAATGQLFEVVYYPRATISEFCVKAHAVKASLQLNWAPGMRFKMAVETEDASRISWFMGTISKVQEADPSSWPKSPWKMLQVIWDEPEMLQGIGRVSPWQVELVSPMQLPLFSLPKKKPRLSQPSDFPLDGAGIPMGALASNLLGHINPWNELAEHDSVGMQGARHDRSYSITSPDIGSGEAHQNLLFDHLYRPQEHFGMNGARLLTENSVRASQALTVKELNMGSFVNTTRPNGHSNHLHTLLPVGTASNECALSSIGTSYDKGGSYNSSKSAPFLLFGKAIDTSQVANFQASANGNASRDAGHEAFYDGKYKEIPGQIHTFFSAPPGSQHTPLGKQIGTPCQGQQALGISSYEARTPDWLNQAKGFGTTGSRYPQSPFGKVRNEACHTVDLSLFDSYEELYETLSRKYGIWKSEILNQVVCVDSRPIENEPYRDFTKRVKWLKLVSEGGENDRK